MTSLNALFQSLPSSFPKPFPPLHAIETVTLPEAVLVLSRLVKAAQDRKDFREELHNAELFIGKANGVTR